ncbi:SDR family oxidoreductase [Vineibacter terrae]|uniref:SDR family oxidoreductase n=1 Tax=Vineibacter terrae TaxID=2586908 RepID=A0A5C8PHK0_9HYPH|nr:glucose 1-dehydrogenase [Vineibacter terrae]TXL73286.1 SDR family oxidoreductase [Vineibacter terrae]
MPRLDAKTLIITGGASGIGAATCRLAAAAGATVVVADLATQADHARQVVADSGRHAVFMPLDVTVEADWEQLVDDTVARFGRLDGLLNGAGIGMAQDIESCSLDDFHRVYRVNGLGVFLGCKHAVRVMRASGGGSIVNISSVLGLRGTAGTPAYAASKGAVRLLTKNVAVHCARHGYNIRCNSVHPGYIETPMIASRLTRSVDNMTGRQHLENLHPMGRLGQPEEIARLVLFLLSDESSFSTGAEFVADGGLTA